MSCRGRRGALHARPSPTPQSPARDSCVRAQARAAPDRRDGGRHQTVRRGVRALRPAPRQRVARRVCKAPVVRPTLFEFAGGEAAFLALAEAHHARCLADPELNHPFSHDDQHPQHVERLAAYWGEVMGGPPTYTQTCGDESGVLTMHAGNGDMGDLGERFLDCFVRAMDDADLPAYPEFREALRAYMRWAVDNVLSYSSEDAVVPSRIGIPRWDWSGLQA